MARKACYAAIDLLFENEEYCHFRQTVMVVVRFCKKDGNCEFDNVLTFMSENAFNLITKVSQVASIFKEQKWGATDQDARGYAVSQLANAAASLFTDLFGFKPSKDLLEPLPATQ